MAPSAQCRASTLPPLWMSEYLPPRVLMDQTRYLTLKAKLTEYKAESEAQKVQGHVTCQFAFGPCLPPSCQSFEVRCRPSCSGSLKSASGIGKSARL